MTAMLDFKDVELYYDHVYALKAVSLSVSQGETVALIGGQWSRQVINLAHHHWFSQSQKWICYIRRRARGRH